MSHVIFLGRNGVRFSFDGRRVRGLAPESLRRVKLHSGRSMGVIRCGQGRGVSQVMFGGFMFKCRGGRGVLGLGVVRVSGGSVATVMKGGKVKGSAFLQYVYKLREGYGKVVRVSKGMCGEGRHLGRVFLIVRSMGRRLFARDMLSRILVDVGRRGRRGTLSVLGSLSLLRCERQRPISLSKKRGREITITATVTSRHSILLFSRPADKLSCHRVLRITHLFRGLHGRKGAVLIIARSLRFVRTLRTGAVYLRRLRTWEGRSFLYGVGGRIRSTNL